MSPPSDDPDRQGDLEAWSRRVLSTPVPFEDADRDAAVAAALARTADDERNVGGGPDAPVVPLVRSRRWLTGVAAAAALVLCVGVVGIWASDQQGGDDTADGAGSAAEAEAPSSAQEAPPRETLGTTTGADLGAFDSVADLRSRLGVPSASAADEGAASAEAGAGAPEVRSPGPADGADTATDRCGLGPEVLTATVAGVGVWVQVEDGTVVVLARDDCRPIG